MNTMFPKTQLSINNDVSNITKEDIFQVQQNCQNLRETSTNSYGLFFWRMSVLDLRTIKKVSETQKSAAIADFCDSENCPTSIFSRSHDYEIRHEIRENIDNEELLSQYRESFERARELIEKELEDKRSLWVSMEGDFLLIREEVEQNIQRRQELRHLLSSLKNDEENLSRQVSTFLWRKEHLQQKFEEKEGIYKKLSFSHERKFSWLSSLHEEEETFHSRRERRRMRSNEFDLNEAREQFLAAQTANEEFLRANAEMEALVRELQSVKQAIALAEEEQTALKSRYPSLVVTQSRMKKVKHSYEELQHRLENHRNFFIRDKKMEIVEALFEEVKEEKERERVEAQQRLRVFVQGREEYALFSLIEEMKEEDGFTWNEIYNLPF